MGETLVEAGFADSLLRTTRGSWQNPHRAQHKKIHSREAHVAWNYTCTDTASRPENKRENHSLCPPPPRVMPSSPTPRLVSYSMAEEERDACQRSTRHYGKMMTGAGRSDDLMSELRASMMLLYARNHVWRVCASGAKTCMRARERVPKGSDVMFSLSLLGAPPRPRRCCAVRGKWLIIKESSMERKTYGG